MRPSQTWPFILSVLVLGIAGCTGPIQNGVPAIDVPLSSAAAAQACAAKLPPAASIIYNDAASDVHAETNLETLLRVKVMMLIVTDHIKRAEARPAAERAAECLEMLKQ